MKGGIFLLLGSNQGNPEENLATAKNHIAESVGVIVRASSRYVTEPWGDPDQPDFNNQVIEIATALSPQKVLAAVLDIEKKMGRVRSKKWGARIIDIDILLFNDLIMTGPELLIPHPGIPARKFTLLPLAEIAGDVVHPLTGKSIRTMLRECADTLSVTRAG